MSFRQILFGVLMWAVFIYALRRGSWEERLAASGIVIAAYLTVLVDSPLATRFTQVETSVLFVDIGQLLLMLFISLRSKKFWPLWLTAMHALTILAHLAPYVPHMLPWGYWRAAAVWSWPMLIVLGFAIHQRHREQSVGAQFGI
jgi:hypothetical protein